MLNKTWAPADVEARWYPLWERAGAFAANPDSNLTPYTIMMPPPNVTGSLHMGHALTFTLQDILIRYHRLRGRERSRSCAPCCTAYTGRRRENRTYPKAVYKRPRARV